MPENDDDSNSITSLHEHVREKIERARKKLTLGARMRFILLFALFDAMFAMFCLLVLLSLRIQSLEESLEEVRAGAQETAVAAATQVAGVRETVEAEMATKTAPLFKPSLVPPTVSPTYTLNPTYTPVPTDVVVVTPTALANPPPLIFSITPNAGTIAASEITVTLRGSAFAPGAMIEMQREGEPLIAARDVKVISPTQITCVLTRATTGVWSVRVINPDQQSAILLDAFRVDSAGSQ